MSKPIVKAIRISEVRENLVALRAVDRDSEAYIGLRDSIMSKGILNPINVRQRSETIEGNENVYFELVDGLHRYSAAVDCGITELNVQVVSLTDAEVLEAQLMANVHKIDTKPVEYTRQMTRIFAGNPTMTIADMATRLCKSASWVSQRLGLLKLDDKIGKLVDNGDIAISKAVVLSKLPRDEQINFVDQAMTMSVEEFAPTVQARAKELRDAAAQGRAASEHVFVPVMRMQKLPVLREEFETPAVGPALCKQQNIKDGPAGFRLGLAWALKMDPASIEIQRAKAEEKAADLAEAKKKRALDRAEKKAKAAAEAAAALTG